MGDPGARPFALSADQQRLADQARGLAREVLVPLAAAGRPGRVNRELVRALGEHGLLARLFPSTAGAASASAVPSSASSSSSAPSSASVSSPAAVAPASISASVGTAGRSSSPTTRAFFRGTARW